MTGIIILSVILVALCIVIGLGSLYQLIGAARDRRAYPFEGKLVDVGGYRLHLLTAGEGTPTVVMDTGLGHTSPVWSLVAPAVAAFTRVVTYDRAGYGWSDSGPTPRTSQHIARELHTALANAGIAGPFILVGHSFGGLNMYVYATQYPAEVAGLILLDAVPRNIGTYNATEFRQFVVMNRVKFRILTLATRQGITRAYMRLRGSDAALDFVSKLPVAQQPGVLSGVLRKTFAAAAAESAVMEASVAFASTAQLPPDLPLVVLAHGIPDMFTRSMPAHHVQEAEESWQTMQTMLAKLSTHGKLIIAEHAGHKIHIDQPELVIDTIRRMVEEVQHATQSSQGD